MPSLVSITERAVLTGIFSDIFDTFQRTITVYKAPIKVSSSPIDPNGFVYGFGASQSQSQYNYNQVFTAFPATIRYADQDLDQNPETNAMISAGEVSIKVRKDCRDYINNGLTQKIVVDGRSFFLDSDERKSTFLDSEFYIFKLKATK